MTEAFRCIPNYTVKDYEQWEGDWELWDGHPVSLDPPASFLHQRVAGRVLYQLCSVIKESGSPFDVIQTVDWRISQHTVVRPDIQLFCEPVETHWVEQTPALIVEVVSPESAEKDRIAKRRLYGQQGVKYYLIVDPEAKTVEALTLQGDTYAPIESGEAPLSFDLHDGCKVSLEVAALWK